MAWRALCYLPKEAKGESTKKRENFESFRKKVEPVEYSSKVVDPSVAPINYSLEKF
jgi:hypothetical protein